MFLATAVLFFQFFPIPQTLISTDSATPAVPDAAVLELSTATGSESDALTARAYQPGRLTPEPVDSSVPPEAAEAAAGVNADLDAPAPGRFEDAKADLLYMQERAEAHSHRRVWLALSVAQHGAATFDAWSTRRAIESGYGRETNPMLRPFAGNASLYAAIQAGPTLLDYVGRRMMTSRKQWLRRTWWVPQVVGTAVSIAGGVHNLRVARGPAAP